MNWKLFFSDLFTKLLNENSFQLFIREKNKIFYAKSRLIKRENLCRKQKFIFKNDKINVSNYVAIVNYDDKNEILVDNYTLTSSNASSWKCKFQELKGNVFISILKGFLKNIKHFVRKCSHWNNKKGFYKKIFHRQSRIIYNQMGYINDTRHIPLFTRNTKFWF